MKVFYELTEGDKFYFYPKNVDDVNELKITEHIVTEVKKN